MKQPFLQFKGQLFPIAEISFDDRNGDVTSVVIRIGNKYKPIFQKGFIAEEEFNGEYSSNPVCLDLKKEGVLAYLDSRNEIRKEFIS
ncbi:hypothetical protein ABET15_04365 [Heyndrickxia faecalis]|uniref:hypothetical protein n=1 Tax=Heyndrickxia TaxID=2837504 RepID=UPI0022362B4F|nr:MULTISPECIES: hypothetical protein [Heyndrickxia]MED4866140.1 hypothetical protein [Weizmannia sp. CD-2023]UZH06377.1 hypothetical protein ONG97_00060 [Heyndrickxia coagulans]UZH06432.1 hypothetical protein ONG97_00375 [Heyndrickxia coagulans]